MHFLQRTHCSTNNSVFPVISIDEVLIAKAGYGSRKRLLIIETRIVSVIFLEDVRLNCLKQFVFTSQRTQLRSRTKASLLGQVLRVPGGWGSQVVRSALLTGPSYPPPPPPQGIFLVLISIMQVAVSIPDGVIGIFHWHNRFGRTMALGSAQPVTEMSTKNISSGIKAADA
jgi:hypothetical protein